MSKKKPEPIEEDDDPSSEANIRKQKLKCWNRWMIHGDPKCFNGWFIENLNSSVAAGW